MTLPTIDWSKLDRYPESTCTCTCDAVFRSHAKAVIHGGDLVVITRIACPGCGKTDSARSVESDVEEQQLHESPRLPKK